MPNVPWDILVLLDASLVAFEVDNVDWVKSDQSHEKSQIHVGELIADQVFVALKNLLYFV